MNVSFFKAHTQYSSSQLPGYADVSGTALKHMKVVKKFPCCVSKTIKIARIAQCSISSKACSCSKNKKTNISTISLLPLEQHLKAAESEECKMQRCWGRDEDSEKHWMETDFQGIPWNYSIHRTLPLKFARDSNYRLLGGIKGSLWQREILQSIKNGTMSFQGIPCISCIPKSRPHVIFSIVKTLSLPLSLPWKNIFLHWSC